MPCRWVFRWLSPARARRVPAGRWWLGIALAVAGDLGGCSAPGSATGATPRTMVAAAAVDHPRQLRVGDSRIEVVFDEPPGSLEAPALAWVSRAATAVTVFYGRFVVPELRVELTLTRGAGMRHGRVTALPQPVIHLSLGRRTEARHFDRDWRMTHEMIHLAFPAVPARHHWLEEGLATYVEPIARARVGWLTEEAVWLEWLENMPRGLRRAGDGGLDSTTSWARTYWGGALFCLVADVELRKHSDNRQGLSTALRAIVEAGGSMSRRWTLERALEIADASTGRSVLGDLHRKLGVQPGDVDLAGLFRELGVARRGREVFYRDDAPLAHVRRALVRGELSGPARATAADPTAADLQLRRGSLALATSSRTGFWSEVWAGERPAIGGGVQLASENGRR